MASKITGTQRTRGWVLVKTEEGVAHDISEVIRKLKTSTNSFIIRADVVAGEFNIVCALDMQDQAEYDDLVKKIMSLEKVLRSMSLVVEPFNTHNPYPPHDTTGTMTDDEAAASSSNHESGTTGFNPWG